VTKEITKSDLESELSGGGLTSGPQSFGDNYVITPSIAANNLTVALKTVAGADPSSTDKITIRIGNTKRQITAAISTTKAAGTNWCNAGSSELAAQDVDYFVYLIQETGASAGTKIGFSRIPCAKTMGDFVNTSTNGKYIAGNWTNFNSTDEVENIGRFRAQLSAGAGYNWSIPTAKVFNRPVYETDWLNWTPTLVGFSSNPTSTVYQYQISGLNITINLAQSGNGTSNSTVFTASLPIVAKNLTNMLWNAPGYAVDNSAGLANPPWTYIQAAGTVINLHTNWQGAAWTASGGKRAFVTTTYQY